MKTTLVLYVLIGFIYAEPSGIYHEEYQYKSSSQSFRNNELQHQNEDEGFFSKDGDLEGLQKPKVQSHEQHSQYVNPKSQYGYNQGDSFASQYGNHMGSPSLSSLTSIYDKPSLVSSGYGTGSSYSANAAGYASLGHDNSGGYYSSGSSISSDVLSQLSQRVQQDLSRQLQEAIRNQYRQSSAYNINTATIQSDIRYLEQEIKRNLTAQLEEALRTQHGTQSTLGSNTDYVRGNTNPTPVYNSRQFNELKMRLENDLIRQLHDQVRSVYSTSSHTSTSYQTSGGTLAHIPVPRPIQLNVGTYNLNQNADSLSSYTTHGSYRQYTPIPNPDSITVIASRIQNDLNNYLNTILHETQSKYLSSTNSYLTVSNLDNYIDSLKYQLQRNITTLFDEEIRRNYGNQITRNDYSYSVAVDGAQNPNYNYKVSDLDNLKRQVEQHLLSKLERDFQSIRQRYLQRSYSTINTSTYRPVIYSPGNNGHLMTTNLYGHTNSATTTGFTGSQMNSLELNDLQRQLRQDLSRQVQEALTLQRTKQSSASTSLSSFNPNENYNYILQQLTDELQRNLTQRLQQSLQGKYSGSSSYVYGVTSGGYSPYSDQVASLRSQLQNDLMQQLRQGLQESYSKYSSFSASSSSSSNYGYGSSSQLMNDDPYDCMMSDDSKTSATRLKRSVDDPTTSLLKYNYHAPPSGKSNHMFSILSLTGRHHQHSSGSRISGSHNTYSDRGGLPNFSSHNNLIGNQVVGRSNINGYPREILIDSGRGTVGTGNDRAEPRGTGIYSYPRHITYHG